MTRKRKILELFQSGDITEKAVGELLKLNGEEGTEKSRVGATPLFEEPIAIIGMACRLPGADSVDEFWVNLREGRNAVREVPAERWSEDMYFSVDLDHPGRGYARWGGFLDGIFDFDHEFFGLTREEATVLDPQQRLMLEVGQHAFDHAGYGGDTKARRRTSVFIGGRTNNYGREYFEGLNNLPTSDLPSIPINRASLLGKSQNFMACWISDRLNLHGPAMVVDTACSSSLTSFHLACQSLRLGECDMALAGGVDLLIDPMTYVMLSKAKALSPDGLCFVFDSRANGYVPGEGAGAVLLKPLSAARRDGDHIYALARASSVNNDGQTMGITTPSMDAQIALLESIYQPDCIHPDSVGYIEAHGTGTTIGDPIEVKALSEVFRRHSGRFAYCPIGSVKTNIGHLHSAAGISSIIKTALCLYHGAIPASLNCETPNPRFEFISSPFYPNLGRRAWPGADGIRRAGISGFGFGGTNCHVVLEAAPAPVNKAEAGTQVSAALLPLSAFTRQGMLSTIETYREHLSKPDLDFISFCAVAQTGRYHHKHRLAVVARDRIHCMQLLESFSQQAEADHFNFFHGVKQSAAKPVLHLHVARRPDENVWRGWSKLYQEVVEFRDLLIRLLEKAPQKVADDLCVALKGSRMPTSESADLGIGILPLTIAELLEQWEVAHIQFTGDVIAELLTTSRDVEAYLSAMESLSTASGNDMQIAEKESACEWVLECAASVPEGHGISLWANEGGWAGLLRLLADAYARGADIRWSSVNERRPFSKMALPDSVYHKVTCKLPEVEKIPINHTDDRVDKTVHKKIIASQYQDSLVDWCERDSTDVIRFRRCFSRDDVLLHDHRVLGTAMIPGVAWLEFIRTGWILNEPLSADTTKPFCFNDVTFLKPLVIEKEERVIAECTIQPNGDFEVSACIETEAAEPVLLMRGTITAFSPLSVQSGALPDSSELQSRTMGDDVYAQLRSLGYFHGPFFQNIAWMADWGSDQTYACLRRAARPDKWPATVLDPGLMDSATIVAFGSGSSTSVRSGGRPFIPMFLGKVHVYAPLPDEVFVHTRIHVWNQEMCRCSQVIMDDKQRPCVVIEDIVSKRVPADGFTNNIADTVVNAKPGSIAQIVAVETDNRTTNQSGVMVEHLLGFFEPHMDIKLEPRDLDTPFLSLGMDSASLVALAGKIEKQISAQLYPTIFFEYPTPREFLAFLLLEHRDATTRFGETSPTKNTGLTELSTDAPDKSMPVSASLIEVINVDAVIPNESNTRIVETSINESCYESVAVIGMAGRYPQAADLDIFWQRLCQGTDSIEEIPAERWNWRDYFDPEMGVPGKTYSRWGAFLDRVDGFDAGFFGIAPSEAAAYDPQARLFFSVAWETLEHAGYGAQDSTPVHTGVWVGYSHDHYYEQRIRGNYNQLRGLSLETSVANQFSYFMNWRGPSLVVNTLCSSSLVALHQAIISLQRGECEMALAGGVHAALSPEYYVAVSHQRALSPTGRCHTFDARADGYVPGEGVGAVLLKPLKKAQEDGDKIWGVITGSAINHGGRASRATAPNPEAQTEVIVRAMELAGVTGADISYVEIHGTGTKIGDPLEVGALKKAFSDTRNTTEPCRLGAVKSTIGHLESAAGIAGLHKVLLSMHYRQLPPTCHVVQANPALDLENSRFILNDQLCDWTCDGKRRAGLSAFGMFGVNAHVIIEEAPARPVMPLKADRTLHPLTLSARSEKALRDLVERYTKMPLPEPDAFPHICFTANTGRTHFDYRLGVAGSSWSDVQNRLKQWLHGSVDNNQQKLLISGKSERSQPSVAFMFTGQGSQYPGMAKTLYETQPLFRRELLRCTEVFQPHLDRSLLSLIIEDEQEGAIHETKYTQPALFAVEYALAGLWMSWGVQPAALTGHSVGEYVAACVAEVMTLEDAARLVAARGRLMQGLDRNAGAMTAVLAPLDDFMNELKLFDQLGIAALNSPVNVVISGCRQQMKQFCDILRTRSMMFMPLNVSHAFHSQLMKPVRNEFIDVASSISFCAPKLPVISNLSGEVMTHAPDANYWWQHLLGTVNFVGGITTLDRMGINIFLETGPHPVLCEQVRASLPEASHCLATLKRGSEDWETIYQSMLVLYIKGVSLDWRAFDADYQRIRLPLPGYPFEDKSYWIHEQPIDGPIKKEEECIMVSGNHLLEPHPLLGSLVTPEKTSGVSDTDDELIQSQPLKM